MDKGRYREELRALEESCKPIDEAIALQSVKGEEVQEAIEQLQTEYVDDFEGYPASCGKWNRNIDLAIAALQEYQPWVSVKDRLPDEWIPVLVTYIGCNDGKPRSDGVARWRVKENAYVSGWLWDLDRSEVAVEITHWKPLPEIPRGNNNEA